MKILLLLMGLCNFIYKPSYTNDFLIELAEKEVIEDDNIIINNNGNISFLFNSILLCNIKCVNYSYLIDNDNFYLTFIDENILYIRKYDTNAKLVKSAKFNDYIYTDSQIKIIKNDNNLVLFSTVYENEYTNIKIIELDDKLNNNKNTILKGELNDSFYDCEYFQDHYYLLVCHDKMSGGDFGYGGNLVLSLLDLDYNVEKNKYFNAENGKISINNGSVVNLITNQGTYSYDLKLEAIFGLNFPYISYFWSKSISDLYLSLSKDKLEIYEIVYDSVNNCNSFHLLKTYNYDLESKYLCEVIELNNKMYLKFTDDYQYYLYELNIYDTRNFVEEVNYLTAFNDINQYIDSWYQRLYLEKDDNHFDADVNGTYEVTYKNADFEKKMTIKVLEEANVEEGMIYPIGYKLYFTGVALLNNKMIHNNYSIDKVGKYTLELYSNTKEKRIINFIVDQNQISFQDNSFKTSDFIAYVNQDVSLEYQIEGIDEINKVIVDEKEYHDYVFKDHILKINFNHDESGFYHHIINSIDEIEINDVISFNIIDSNLSLDFNLCEERKTIKLNFLNDNDNLRLFNLYLDDKLYKSYPISENNIILPYESNYREAKITLTYANNDGTYSSCDLASFILSDNKSSDLLNIEIGKKEETVKEFSLIVKNKKNIEKIKYADKIIYEKTNDESQSSIYLLIFLVLANILAYSYYLFKVLKINLKKVLLMKKNRVM